MVGWYHQHNGHGFGWTSGVGDGQGSLVRETRLVISQNQEWCTVVGWNYEKASGKTLGVDGLV